MVQIAATAAVLAGLVHVYIFVLESFLWTTERARTIFGLSEQEAATTRPLALNQGFYNLFLAVAAVGGAVTLFAGSTTVGATLVFTAAGSMVLAAVVLVVSAPDKARPALVQGILPLVAVVALAVGLL